MEQVTDTTLETAASETQVAESATEATSVTDVATSDTAAESTEATESTETAVEEGESGEAQVDPDIAALEAELAFTEETEGGVADAGQVETSSTEAPGATIGAPPSVTVSDIQTRWTELKAKVEERWATDDYDNTVESALMQFIEGAILPAVQSGVRAEESYRASQVEAAGRSVADAAVKAVTVIAETYGVRVDGRTLIKLAQDGAYEAICKIDGKPMGIPTADDFTRIIEVKYGSKLTTLASRQTAKKSTAPRTVSKAVNVPAEGPPKTRAEQILADFYEGSSVKGR
jgi:hypothetical protein